MHFPVFLPEEGRKAIKAMLDGIAQASLDKIGANYPGDLEVDLEIESDDVSRRISVNGAVKLDFSVSIFMVPGSDTALYTFSGIVPRGVDVEGISKREVEKHVENKG